MKRVLVRYKVKSDRAEENTDYIQKVFAELQQNSPDGLRYASFKLEDGVSFVHIASIETESGNNPLAESSAFKNFQAEIKDRCEEPPVAVELNEIGSFKFFEK
ncbi:MAG: hypothetical protein JSW63_02255 [Ignavibacterium sp.]|nr:MAG: hypothetical protein JSW63_02255 [Ignavibacterium sp.]